MPKPRFFKKKKGLIKRPKRLFFRKKQCVFCTEKIPHIDYKDLTRLNRFISERGKIIPRRASGTCAKHQRRLVRAIKQARFIALLPFIRK